MTILKSRLCDAPTGDEEGFCHHMPKASPALATPSPTLRLNLTEASPAATQDLPPPSVTPRYPYCRVGIANCSDADAGTDWLSDSQEQIYGGFGLGAALGLLFFALIYFAWFRPWYKRRCQTVRRAWLRSQGDFSEDIAEAAARATQAEAVAERLEMERARTERAQ
ncbi:hypothetical protein B0J14DRAFT_652462 [Halenospora varia]|nr:hypothetical protein B0J14DRAFT_652462 [Halenospora varia]